MNAIPSIIDLAEAGAFQNPVDVSLRAIEMAKSLYPYPAPVERCRAEDFEAIEERRRSFELVALDKQFAAWKAEAEAADRMLRKLAWEESRRHHVGRDAL